MAKDLFPFLGTYVDRDHVFNVSRWADRIAWIILAIYMVDLLIALLTFYNQFVNNFWPAWIDTVIYLLSLIMRLSSGMLFFLALHAISRGLLILLDIEENTRRAARKQQVLPSSIAHDS